MSVKVMSWVFEHSRSTLADRLVLLAIADHANHDGLDAYPSIDHLARKARVSRATVQRSINNLVDLKELKVERGSGRGHTNHFRILIEGPQIEALSFERASSTQEKGLIHADRASLIKPSLTSAPARPPLPPDASKQATQTAKEVLAKAKSNTPLGKQARKVS